MVTLVKFYSIAHENLAQVISKFVRDFLILKINTIILLIEYLSRSNKSRSKLNKIIFLL